MNNGEKNTFIQKNVLINSENNYMIIYMTKLVIQANKRRNYPCWKLRQTTQSLLQKSS